MSRGLFRGTLLDGGRVQFNMAQSKSVLSTTFSADTLIRGDSDGNEDDNEESDECDDEGHGPLDDVLHPHPE